MFEQFVKRPFHLALYRNGPYAEERSRFLAHLVQEGPGRNRLKVINWLLLEVAKYIDLSGQRFYTTDVVTATAERWQKSRESKVTNLRRARIAILDFMFVASSWLHFLGRFEDRTEELPYAKFLGEFFAFLRDERGFAEATILGHRRSLKTFLSWPVRENIPLSAVSPQVISKYFSSEVVASHHDSPVNDGDPLAGLCCGDSALLPRWATADHDQVVFGYHPSSSSERALQLLRSELQPPSAWRRRPSGWRLALQPCGCWLAWHTTVRGQG